MSYQIPKMLGDVMDQTEAAACAVLVAHIRMRMEKDTVSDEERPTMQFLQELEAIACASIARNDGNVVYHIGCAAKQMNPLLS